MSPAKRPSPAARARLIARIAPALYDRRVKQPELRGPVQQWYDSVTVLTLPADNGTWSVTLDFPADTTPGEYLLGGGCDNGYYLDGGFYPDETITVTAAAGVNTPAPTPTGTQAAVTRAIRGAAANTPGITSTTKGSTSAAATAPGTQITKILKGFKPGEEVKVVLHSTPTVLGTFIADANGVVTATFTVPQRDNR